MHPRQPRAILVLATAGRRTMGRADYDPTVNATDAMTVSHISRSVPLVPVTSVKRYVSASIE